jgi:hypothetical protein
MATVNATARLTGLGLFEHFWLASDPRPNSDRRALNRVRAWGVVSGMSTDPQFAGPGPNIDPVVGALYRSSNYYGPGPH